METLKPNELRIGNWVEYPYWNKDGSPAYFKVRDIFTDDAKIALTNGIIQLPSSRLDYIAPIPITYEIPFKLVFGTSLVSGLDYHKGLFTLDLGDLTFKFGNHWFSLNQYKYVHQLQNLYFALTNEELTVKL